MEIYGFKYFRPTIIIQIIPVARGNFPSRPKRQHASRITLYVC
jgi:hypothetical protein